MSSWKFSHFYLFPKNVQIFILQKFLMTFLVINYKFGIPLFSLFQYISPNFAKIIIFPLLLTIFPVFVKFTWFFTYFMCISFPPTLMHHPMHVLDAPGQLSYKTFIYHSTLFIFVKQHIFKLKFVNCYAYFIHSFILTISIAPLQVLYRSEALPTTARILYRSFTPKRTGNCR